MSLDSRILKKVINKRNENNLLREQLLAKRKAEIYEKLPRIRQIDDEIKLCLLEIANNILTGSEIEEIIKTTQIKATSLKTEKMLLLKQTGYDENFLSTAPLCDKCDDTGYIGSKICDCLLKEYKKEQTKDLSALLKVENQSFDNFNLSIYSTEIYLNNDASLTPRKQMEYVFDACFNYAKNFSTDTHQNERDKNLFMHGNPGLGKTFLSACIAKEVVNKGYSVSYDTAFSFFGNFENRRFGREDEGTAQDINRYYNCDLLILDDLGTEMSNAFSVSVLYNIINTRITKGMHTIINTNLDILDMETRYSSQIYSRLNGLYTRLVFIGNDIRNMD